MNVLAEIEELEKQADYFPSKTKRMNTRPMRPKRPGGLSRIKPHHKKSPVSQPLESVQQSSHTTQTSSPAPAPSPVGFEIDEALQSLI